MSGSEDTQEYLKAGWRAWHYILDQWQDELENDEPISGAGFVETAGQAFDLWQKETKELKPESNSNCLAGLKCPKCGSLEPFNISTNSVSKVYDDGVSESYDTDWDGESHINCLGCNHSGTVKEFTLVDG